MFVNRNVFLVLEFKSFRQLELPYGPKMFPRYEVGSINYFCTKIQKVILGRNFEV